MTWYLDPETGDVYGPDGQLVGTADGPPFTIPDDVRTVVATNVLPADDAAVRGEHLRAVLEVSGGDVEFGQP